jgi:hypothetical protein
MSCSWNRLRWGRTISGIRFVGAPKGLQACNPGYPGFFNEKLGIPCLFYIGVDSFKNAESIY